MRAVLALSCLALLGSTSVALAKFHQGSRVITLPRLAEGSYRLTLSYSGTDRIKKVARSAGRLRVISH